MSEPSRRDRRRRCNSHWGPFTSGTDTPSLRENREYFREHGEHKPREYPGPDPSTWEFAVDLSLKEEGRYGHFIPNRNTFDVFTPIAKLPRVNVYVGGILVWSPEIADEKEGELPEREWSEI